MLPHRFIARLVNTFCTKQITTGSQNLMIEPAPKDQKRITNNKQGHNINFKKLVEPAYFGQLTYIKHPISQVIRVLDVISSSRAGFNNYTFANVFKKYCYYVEKIPNNEDYVNATIEQKIKILQLSIDIYVRYGTKSSKPMRKSLYFIFNQISQHLINQSKNITKNTSKQQVQIFIENLARSIESISILQHEKSDRTYKHFQKMLCTKQFLEAINFKSSISLLKYYRSSNNYNRLIFEIIIDNLNSGIDKVDLEALQRILDCLAGSGYSVNKYLLLKIIKKVTTQFNKLIDHKTGLPASKNNRMIGLEIRILQSLSLIEKNINLSHAYLPELDKLFEVHLFHFLDYLENLDDIFIRKYSNLVRRSGYYNQNILNKLIFVAMQRKVVQLQVEDFQQLRQNKEIKKQRQSKKIHKNNKFIKIQTICCIIHAMATHNCRHQGMIQYFIKLMDLLEKKNIYQENRMQEKVTQIIQKTEELSNRKYNMINKEQNKLYHMMERRYYDRVLWSLCVIGHKQELSKIYHILQKFMLSVRSPRMNISEARNLYYCYLLLKTYFPRKQIDFANLLTRVQNRLQKSQLRSEISQSHEQLYETCIEAGIAALKQYNISNLMCDIFVPRYWTIKNKIKYQVSNLIIDFHGRHHFLRNCDRINGSSALKKKILQNEGYIYQYISVHEWDLSVNKKQFVILFMDSIAEKYGVQSYVDEIQNRYTRKLVSRQSSTKSLNLRKQQRQEDDEQYTTKIDSPKKKGRKISTNSIKLQYKLKQSRND